MAKYDLFNFRSNIIYVDVILTGVYYRVLICLKLFLKGFSLIMCGFLCFSICSGLDGACQITLGH